ncbi:Putative Flp pilus-assembly TadE/G-like [Kaistia soli DSM 19436]|uniref:Putative Flp pilus-assembly TadE/G-like n=1 Tax=Kaistia soli DSM 19436 TaxID=1122133 RepID=A0A1M4UTS0_9HYPH|nr:pilus assembly protein TadG-related protein [Kaistia soli]SHE60075.1 Putative Flp pilus-assembly TadE/G-like [Kaistia soli DSM 19436]
MPPAECPSQTDDAAISRRYMVHDRPLGNTAALFGFLAIALVTITGATIDLSRVIFAREDLKERLDAALIAGAREAGGKRRVIAENVFDATPTGSIARTTGRQFDVDISGVSGTVSAAVPTTLASVLGIRSIRVTANGRAAVLARACGDRAAREKNATRCAVTVTSSTHSLPLP